MRITHKVGIRPSPFSQIAVARSCHNYLLLTSSAPQQTNLSCKEAVGLNLGMPDVCAEFLTLAISKKRKSANV
jgi:hypothetical protein